MKPTPKTPPDLDREAKKKWRELVGTCEPDADLELLSNFCRQHSSLLSIRREKAKQENAGIFQTMLPGRDGTMQLNPLLTAENRLIASLNRTLKSLGLSPSREQTSGRATFAPTPPPPGMSGPEPKWGWDLERTISGQAPEPSANEIEADRRRKVNEKLLAANDWRAYEQNFDGGKEHGSSSKS